MNNTNVKKRNWAFVAYPESLPKDWESILQLSGVTCSISPLHDQDIDPDANNSIKKPHYHIILIYGNTTTKNNVESLTKRLNATIPIPIDSVNGYYRYFTHMDNPEKHQYNPSDIKNINGFCITDYVEITATQKLKIKAAIQNFILDNDIIEYCDLCDSVHKFKDLSEYDGWYDIVTNNTLFFNSYLKSRKFKLLDLASRKKDTKK